MQQAIIRQHINTVKLLRKTQQLNRINMLPDDCLLHET